MNPFISYLGQTALSISIFYLLYWLFLRQETFFRFNRYYFLASIVIAFIIPFLDLGNLVFFKDSLPDKTISYGFASLQDPIPDTNTVYLNADSSKHSLAEYMLIFYLIGIGFLISRLLYQMVKLFLKIWKARIIRMFETKIVLDKKVNSPFSFFFWIFLNPAQIKEPKISDIILHEKEHIYQRHSFDLFLVELMCSIQWANPFVWMLRKSIKETHEYLADRAVLDHGIQVQDYQKLLLSQSMGVGYPALIAPLNYSINKKRMIMMQKIKSPNIRKWRSLLIIPVVLFLSLAFSNPFSTQKVPETNLNSKQTFSDSTIISDNVSVDLYILDGKEISKNELKSIQYEMISSVTVLKAEEAVKEYGAKAKNGVVILKSRDLSNDQDTEKNIVSGRIFDAQSGEPIPAANIVIMNTKSGTISDEKGNFMLEFLTESAQLSFSMLGYGKVIREVKDGDNIEIRLNRFVIGSPAVSEEKFTSPYLQKYEVSGKVILDESDEPIPGVSIVISNTHTGAVTDMQGNFKLQLPEETVQLVFSYVGLGTVKREVKDGDKLVIKLKKTVATLNLDAPEVIHVEEVVEEESVAEEKSSTEVFYVVEEMPHFPGGKRKLSEYISSNIKYPKNARKSKVTGTVPVNFTVDAKGNIKNVFIAKGKGIDPDLDKEAIRIISAMPNWEPGSQRGKNVAVDLSVPVKFSL